MAFRITAAHDASVQVEFEIPIKGRQNPLFFSVPKLHFIALPTMREYREWFKESAGSVTERDCTLKILEMTTTPKTYEVLEKLTDGELAQISKHWEEVSTVDLGESSASSDS